MWWEAYVRRSKYYEGYRNLMAELPDKAARLGYLERDDLYRIAVWGGNQHGIGQTMLKRNTQWEVQAKTADALGYIDKPNWALGCMLDLEQWGLTYASKTLMFMAPDKYVALDSRIRESFKQVLPPIRDGNRASLIRGYEEFLRVCGGLQDRLREISGGQMQWRLADVESAVFEFASARGRIAPNLPAS